MASSKCNLALERHLDQFRALFFLWPYYKAGMNQQLDLCESNGLGVVHTCQTQHQVAPVQSKDHLKSTPFTKCFELEVFGAIPVASDVALDAGPDPRQCLVTRSREGVALIHDRGIRETDDMAQRWQTVQSWEDGTSV